jgi:hypothetical protein
MTRTPTKSTKRRNWRRRRSGTVRGMERERKEEEEVKAKKEEREGKK